MSSRIRPGSYKKSLVSREECSSWSKKFSTSFKEQLSKTDLHGLSEAEFAALYVKVGLMILRPTDWRGGAHNEFPYELTGSEAINLFLKHSLRSIPISVNRSIYQWHNNKYPLKLYLEIPSPVEVLRMQTLGYRCVSCITDPLLIESYILDERDAFSFALHDLIHADHFFKNTDWMKAQVGFSRWMLSLYENDEFKKWLSGDDHFAKEFFYAASDMNSHPAHLVKYFKSVLTAAILRSENKNPRDKLTLEQKNKLHEWLEWSASLGRFQSEFTEHLFVLNSEKENLECLKYLTLSLESKFSLESAATSQN